MLGWVIEDFPLVSSCFEKNTEVREREAQLSRGKWSSELCCKYIHYSSKKKKKKALLTDIRFHHYESSESVGK